jgi:hypothetical protein
VKQKVTSKNLQRLFIVLFLFFALWWLYITLFIRGGDHNSINNQVFAATYGVIALLGGVVGLVASRRWGGPKSLLGRALLFFSLGLLAQEFGQLVYSYYVYVEKIQIPYPSLGDIGYFGSVLLYIYAASQFAKAAGVGFALKRRSKQALALVLPLILLIGSYIVFLRGYQFDFSSFKASLTVVLDFGYPLGQATYIAIALLTYLLSKNLLGGVMKRKFLFVLAALVMQYIADFSFLEAAKNSKVFPAGANDFMYVLSYTLMALALNSFRAELNARAAKGAAAKDSEGESPS